MKHIREYINEAKSSVRKYTATNVHLIAMKKEKPSRLGNPSYTIKFKDEYDNVITAKTEANVGWAYKMPSSVNFDLESSKESLKWDEFKGVNWNIEYKQNASGNYFVTSMEKVSEK